LQGIVVEMSANEYQMIGTLIHTPGSSFHTVEEHMQL
jgi:hypothetical protein